MALKMFGMAGAKLYVMIIVALAVVVGGSYAVMDIGADPYTLSGEEEDTFSTKYIDEDKSSIAFTSSPSGASVKISGDTYTTPTGDISLSPGAYDYVASLDDHITKSATENVESGKAKTVNIMFEAVVDDPDATPTPEPDATPDSDATDTVTGTPTPDATPEDDIPYAAVGVRIVAGTAFQAVDGVGCYSPEHWNDVEGKYLYLTDKNTIKLSQTSGWPNGVGDTLIEYDTSVPTSYNDFEHKQTYGSEIDFRLQYTGTSTTGTIGDALVGSFSPPDSPNDIIMKINIVPKFYGFVFDVNKRDGAGPEITDEKVEPVGIKGSSWTLASLASWDPFTTSVIDVYTGPAQGNFNRKFPVHSWAFWGVVLDGNQNWIGGETPGRVVVSALDADDYGTSGDKVLYIRLIDNEQILPASESVAHYKIEYTVTTGYIEDIKVTKI